MLKNSNKSFQRAVTVENHQTNPVLPQPAVFPRMQWYKSVFEMINSDVGGNMTLPDYNTFKFKVAGVDALTKVR